MASPTMPPRPGSADLDQLDMGGRSAVSRHLDDAGIDVVTDLDPAAAGTVDLDPKYGDGGAGAVGQLQGELKAGVALGDVDCVERGAAKVRWGDIRRAHVLD